MSPPLPNPFPTRTHFLSFPHLSISSYLQAPTIYSFPERGLFSSPLTFQPTFVKHPWAREIVDSELWFLPVGAGRGGEVGRLHGRP